MGTAIVCNVFILKKHLKKQLYMWVSSQLQKNTGKTKRFNAFFDTVANLPDCPGKRTAQKI